jgi:hypothetical protein
MGKVVGVAEVFEKDIGVQKGIAHGAFDASSKLGRVGRTVEGFHVAAFNKLADLFGAALSCGIVLARGRVDNARAEFE